MEKKYLIINIGSSSKKYAFYVEEEAKLKAHFFRNKDAIFLELNYAEKKEKREISVDDFIFSTQYLIRELSSKGLIGGQEELSGIGLRIVAPGTYFTENKIINDEYLEKLNEVKHNAPLHTVPMVEEVENLKSSLLEIPLVGISDSTFHAGRPSVSYLYSISKKISLELDLYRFGYHGISIQSLLPKLEKMNGEMPEKVILCHLGSGSSITAIKKGKSLDTSMGFTPLGGLAMGTRAGEITAGAVIYLAKKLNMDLDTLENYLNTKSGLLGLSEESSDVKELLILEKKGDEKAEFALKMFVYQIKKYIGAYTSVLGGLDALVFSGGIGEDAFALRERICTNLNFLGIELNKEKNKAMVDGEGFIQSEDSNIKIVVIESDEVGEIARLTRQLLG